MATSANAASVASPGIPRWVFRWVHIILSVPIIGYIYSPFDLVHYYAPITRFVFVPILVLSGLWMWKGHVVRRLFSKRPAAGAAPYSSR
jgi:thiosulfate reductase cytochrome b subunit